MVDTNANAETRVAEVFRIAARHAQKGEQLPADVVRVIRFLLRGYQ